MSAFLVSDDLIQQLVNLALGRSADGELGGFAFRYPLSLREPALYPSEIGQLLLDENLRSLAARYPDTADPDAPEMADADQWERGRSNLFIPQGTQRHVTIVEGLKMLSCYEYQACEHDSWPTSTARKFCDALRLHLIRRLPGYDAAQWDYDEANDKTLVVMPETTYEA